MRYDQFLNYIGCCEYKFSFFTNDRDSPNRTISVTQFISRILLATSSRLILNSFMINKIILSNEKFLQVACLKQFYFLATLKSFLGLNRLNRLSSSSSSSSSSSLALSAAAYSTGSKSSIFLIYSEACI